MSRKYNIYATLLDAYHYYLKSESDNAFQDFIDRINRVERPKSEAMLRGIAFNELMDLPTLPAPKKGVYTFGWYDFPQGIVDELRAYFAGTVNQYFCEAEIECGYGTVRLYGYIDYLHIKVYDLKTTGSYRFPQYLHGHQHLVYPYCLNKQGVLLNEFEYVITDMCDIFIESYNYIPERDDLIIQNACEDLCGFLEQFRHLITDKKIFGGENEQKTLFS